VPVAIDIDPSVYLKFTSTLKGNAYLGVQYDIATKFRVGVQYENGDLSGIAEGEKVKDEFSFINPRLELEYTGGIGLFFGVDVIIEKLGGPTFNIGPQVMVNAKLSYEMGDDHIDASIEGKAGIGGEVGAKLKIFGFELADWRTYFDIGPQWTIFKYPDDGSGSSGNYDPNYGGGGSIYNTVNLGTLKRDYTAQNGDVITGTLSSNVKISIADGAKVTLRDAHIHGTNRNRQKWAGITCEGDAIISLKGNNDLIGFDGAYPSIQFPEGKTLIICDDGSLTSNSIGGFEDNCGNIIIEGGTITAKGSGGAGIGGGYGAKCGNITIKGGTVTATGGDGAAGIGTGDDGSCGNITITGGIVTATGGIMAAGIGSGWGGSCGSITITDGVTKVTATKGSSATYSIGPGYQGSCGTVTIGGKVTGNISQSPYTYKP
jgi:hypothetical protein